MKTIKYLFTALVLVAIASCNRQGAEEGLTVNEVADSAFYTCYANSSFGMDSFNVERKYRLWWPENGPDELKQEILRAAFGDSTVDFTAATELFIDDLMLFEDDTLLKSIRTESTSNCEWTSYEYISSSYERDNELYLFTICYENYMRFAAHGMYGTRYVTYDNDKQHIVRLCDLVDTAALAPVITRAIEDLVVNKDVLANVYDTKVPLTDNFFIDSARNSIVLVYPLYEIASYACGIQSVVLPIFWLSKHIELTPYAKELFGKGSYLEEAE